MLVEKDGNLATELVQKGLPFALNDSAAAKFAAKCAEALTMLGPGESLLHVQLHSAMAMVLAQSHIAAAREHAERATALASSLNNDIATGYALAALSLVDSMPHHAHERERAARTILNIAHTHDEPHLVPAGFYILLVALLETGKIRELDTKLTGRGDLTSRFAGIEDSEPAGWFRSLRAILDGDIEHALRLVTEQRDRAIARDDSNAMVVFATQMGNIQWMRGTIDGAEDGFLAARRDHPEQILWSASLAWLWLRQGRKSAAETLFLSLRNLDEIAQDRYWLATMTVLAETAIHLGPKEYAEDIHRRIVPFAHQLVSVGAGVAFWGTSARTIGLLEERLGMFTEARTHLELAVTITRKIGAQAWLAEAQIDLAEFAIRHDLHEVPANALLEEALQTSTARGFEELRKRATRRPKIRVMGRFEVTAPDGTKTEWTSRKARELLKMLVAARGVAVSREVYMDVLWPGVDPVTLGNRFSVAINAVRRALDPRRTLPRQHFVTVEGDSVRLEVQHIDVDLERYYALLRHAGASSGSVAEELLLAGAFSDEPYADWATFSETAGRTCVVCRPTPVSGRPYPRVAKRSTSSDAPETMTRSPAETTV